MTSAETNFSSSHACILFYIVYQYTTIDKVDAASPQAGMGPVCEIRTQREMDAYNIIYTRSIVCVPRERKKKYTICSRVYVCKYVMVLLVE